MTSPPHARTYSLATSDQAAGILSEKPFVPVSKANSPFNVSEGLCYNNNDLGLHICLLLGRCFNIVSWKCMSVGRC